MATISSSPILRAAARHGAVVAMALGIGAVSGCTDTPVERPMPPVAATAAPAAQPFRPTPAPAQSPAAAPVGTSEASRVLSKRDIKLASGKPVCDVHFVYAGSEPEQVFWEEPCAAVTAIMIGRRELEAQGDWEELDSFDREFVEAMPGGRVLYVAGEFSASIYPVGTTNVSHEVTVSD